MISYTVSQNGSVIADSINSRGTTQSTISVTPCGEAGVQSYEEKKTFRQDTKGNKTYMAIVSIQDNGPTKCPEGIGGYTRCNKTVLVYYSYYSTNGKATIGGPASNVTACTDGEVDESILDDPITTEVAYKTTEIKQSNVNNYLTTENKTTNIYSYTLVNSTKIKRYTTQTNNFTANTIKYIHQVPRVSLTEVTSKDTIGYKDSKGNTSPSAALNYVDTVVILTDSNILWYRTNRNFPQLSQDLQAIFTSTRKKNENVQVTIPFIKPQLKEAKIYKYDCSSNDTFTKSNVTYKSYKGNYTFVTKVPIEQNLNQYYKATIPIKISYDTIEIFKTTVKEIISKVEKQFDPGARTTDDYVEFKSTFNVKAGTSNWYGLMLTTEKGKKDNPNTFFTHGECIDSNGTRRDFLFVKYRIDGYHKFIPNAASFVSFNPQYVQAQVVPSNLTSFVQNAFLEGGKTFINVNSVGEYGVSVLPNVIIPVPQINPTFVVDDDTKTINFTRNLNFAEVSFSAIENKKTINKVTSYKWQGNGEKGTTYLPEIDIGGSNDVLGAGQYVSIGNPNVIFNSINNNIGKYRDDKTESSLLTRFVAPGYYIQIDGNGRTPVSFQGPQSFNENEKLYIPCNRTLSSVEGKKIEAEIFTHSNLEFGHFFNL